MLTRSIPSTGEQIPAVGLGTWQTFDVGQRRGDRARLEQVLQAFTAFGGTVVDSSPMYGTAEEVVGDLAAALRLRPKLFLATKVWTSGKRAGIEQMNASLKKLRTEAIDLMQVHNLVDVHTHLDTLRGWKQDGLVRYVGITHYAASSHEAVARLIASEPLDFVQINYSAAEPEAETRVLPIASDRRVAVIANRPFAEGRLLRRLASTPLPSWAGDIGAESWAQILLKFVLSHPAITCVIPATSSATHLADNLKAGDGPWPDAALRKRIVADAGRASRGG